MERLKKLTNITIVMKDEICITQMLGDSKNYVGELKDIKVV